MAEPRRDPKDIAKIVCDRWEALDGERSSFKTHWQEIAEYCYPAWEGFFGPMPNGAKRGHRIVDPAGTIALELLAAGMHGMLSNPATTWFDLLMENPNQQNDDAREALRGRRDGMFNALHSPASNITTNLHELYQCEAGLGTGVMWVGHSTRVKLPRRQLSFSTRSLAECCIDEDADGKVDTVVRKWSTWTIRQAVQHYGLEALSEETRKKFNDGKIDEKIALIHAVWPRDDRDETKIDAENMPWASIEVEPEQRHVIRSSGVEEFPYVVPRWTKVAGEVYGRSPAMTALADIKMLQAMTRDLLQAAAKSVRPPLTVHDDTTFGRINTGPDGIIFFRGDQRPEYLPSGANFPINFEMLEGVRQRIYKTFHVDQLQMPTDVEMTATEWLDRTQERLRLLGPTLGRQESELLGPLIDRTHALMERDGAFLPSGALKGRAFVARYQSPLSTAQRSSEANQFLSYMGQLVTLAANAQKPEMLARVKWSDVPTWLSERMSIDARLILDDDEFAEEQKRLEQGNQLVAAGMGAKAARDGAAAIKDLAAAGAQAA